MRYKILGFSLCKRSIVVVGRFLFLINPIPLLLAKERIVGEKE